MLVLRHRGKIYGRTGRVRDRRCYTEGFPPKRCIFCLSLCTNALLAWELVLRHRRKDSLMSFSIPLATRCSSAAAVEGIRLRIAGGEGFETTVDQNSDARVGYRKTAFSSRACLCLKPGVDLSSATKSQRGLPYRASASGDAQMFTLNAWSLLSEPPRCQAMAYGVIRRDRPNEGGEFAGDGDTDDIGWLSGLGEPAISGAQPHLRLPGDLLDRLRQGLVALQDRETHPRRQPIGPGAFDEHASSPACCPPS